VGKNYSLPIIAINQQSQSNMTNKASKNKVKRKEREKERQNLDKRIQGLKSSTIFKVTKTQ